MATSHEFMNAFTMDGTPCIDCEHCKRTHFTSEAEDVDELRDKAQANPEKYIESSDDSLAFGYLDGKQYVYGCPCDSGAKYEAFIWAHREPIAKYLKDRAKAELDQAKRTLEAVS